MRPYRVLAVTLSSLLIGTRCVAFTPARLSQSRSSISGSPSIVLKASLGDRRSFVGNSIASSAAAALSVNTSISTPAAVAADVDMTPESELDARNTKVALWGFGNQNKLNAKYLYERKISVVSVVSRHDIGQDYGMVDSESWGKLGVKTGVEIISEEDAAVQFAALKPDVCIICTRSTIEDLKPLLTVCAKAHVNVITVAEDVLYSWTSSPAVTKEMDALFKANGVSLTGSGFIDGASCEMALTLSSMMQKIEGLQGTLLYNVDDYGKTLANAHGVGLTKAEFEKQIVKKPQAVSYVYNTNEWFVAALGLTLVKTAEVREPTFSERELRSKAVDKMIPAGDCTGMKVVATTTTKEGVTIVSQQIGKCYEKGDEDFVSWGFKGEPAGVQFQISSPPTVQMTSTATISRITQIIAAVPGYVTSDKLPIAKYRHYS
jgi:hypothetical protein